MSVGNPMRISFLPGDLLHESVAAFADLHGSSAVKKSKEEYPDPLSSLPDGGICRVSGLWREVAVI